MLRWRLEAHQQEVSRIWSSRFINLFQSDFERDFKEDAELKKMIEDHTMPQSFYDFENYITTNNLRASAPVPKRAVSPVSAPKSVGSARKSVGPKGNLCCRNNRSYRDFRFASQKKCHSTEASSSFLGIRHVNVWKMSSMLVNFCFRIEEKARKYVSFANETRELKMFRYDASMIAFMRMKEQQQIIE